LGQHIAGLQDIVVHPPGDQPEKTLAFTNRPEAVIHFLQVPANANLLLSNLKRMRRLRDQSALPSNPQVAR
jgi:hypothetical protein